MKRFLVGLGLILALGAAGPFQVPGLTSTGPLTAPSATLTGSGTALNVPNGSVSVGGTLNLSGQLQSALSYDLAATGADARYKMFQTTLAPSAATTNIWENANSFLTLNGPGAANGEINLSHAYFQINSGATSAAAEGYESSMENLGTISGNFTGFLALAHNGSAGTSTSLYGIKFQLTNDNTTAGSVGNYAAIDMEAQLGAGSAPTYNYLIRDADPTSTIATTGHVAIGTISPPGTGRMLQVQGVDNSGGTIMAQFTNLAGTNIIAMFDDGSITISGAMTFTTPATGTAASYACFTSAGKIISSATAC